MSEENKQHCCENQQCDCNHDHCHHGDHDHCDCDHEHCTHDDHEYCDCDHCSHDDHEHCDCEHCNHQQTEDKTEQSPESCDHNCANCSANCSSRIEKFKLNKLSTVRHTIGIVSGKGGVGKSMVTALSACAMNRLGKNVAVLDADITGPSMAHVFGVDDHAFGGEDGIYPATTATNIQLISTNMLLDSEETPVVWRGPILAGLVQQFYSDVIWNDVDYMFVDMPPGTGDVPLTVFQSIPLDGIIVVTTPSDLVSMVVKKAINMANTMNIPILGIVVNMAYFDCVECGCRNYPFGHVNVNELAENENIGLSLELPINPEFTQLCDLGRVEFVNHEPMEAFMQSIDDLLNQ